VRHVFLDADRNGSQVLVAITARRDLPPPSYVLHSSPNRIHVFWRARDFTIEQVERLQKHLAGELGTDPAATPSTQTTRLAGFFNHKPQYPTPPLVMLEYRNREALYAPDDFPTPSAPPRGHDERRFRRRLMTGDRIERARRYLAAVPPAVTGQHGDVHTFRVCCRLVRGFALSDADALSILSEWNASCNPPWTERELRDKVTRARRYGREPIGGLVEAHR
jgi:hypothetical protein